MMRSVIGKYLLVAFAISAFALAKAGHVESTNRIYTPVGGTPVIIGQPEATDTVNLTPKTGSFTDYTVFDLVTFGVDHTYPVYFADSMEVRVKLHIQPYDASDNPGTDFYIYLDLNYNPFGTLAYVDKNAYKFDDAYRFAYTIDSIYIDGVSKDTLPAHLFIDGLIDVERYYDFSTAALDSIDVVIDTLDLNCDTLKDEIEVSWSTVASAEEYQLEWTFVNDYDTSATTFVAASTLSYDFRNNSTRISTVNTYYRIPILFDHGYVIFRVRAIGRDDSDPSQLIFGVWSLDNEGTVSNVSDFYYRVLTPHEADKNWQASTTFAEEGKKKEVVSYFDGSLRNRQTVTRINSDNNTIVGETIYDHQGRPAITVLPVPVTAPDCSAEDSANVLQYYPLFNVDDTLNEYSRNDFDVDDSGDACNTGAGIMDTASGSSNYYSPANNNLTGYQRYVPDANGYPFTQVEYTPDNTGRIRRQGGVGEEFQLGSGHETKYYYGQPNQIQLDRMFGSEVGDATHYKKNLVIDPNGQASVSYLDQEGRVIATSLAGDSTSNLYALDSEGDAADTLTVDLFAKDADGESEMNKLSIDGNSLEFSTHLLVSDETSYTFAYDIAIDTLADTCLTSSICYSCVYDLTIKVIDECGEDLIETNDTIIDKKMIGHFTLQGDTLVVFDTDCSSPSDFDYSKSVSLTLPVGDYTIIKKLTVNDSAVNFYVDSYLDSSINGCFMTLNDFQSQYLSQIDTSNCSITCEDCLEALGDRDQYVAQGKGTAFDYDREYEECLKLCSDNVSMCEMAYQAMLMDMSPGGQYGKYLDANGNINANVIILSVYSIYNKLPARIASSASGTWRYPLITLNGNNYSYYLDDLNNRTIIPLVEDGSNYLPAVANVSLVYQDSNGDYYTYPENLSNLSDFILNWQSGWARSLVQYHPEYCYYESCIEYDEFVNAGDSYTSDDFDDLLRSTNTFAEAVTNQLIRSDYDTVVNPNNRLENWFTDNSSNTKPWDPFVVRTSEYGSYSTQMEFKFDNYSTNGSDSYSLLEMASISARCGILVNVAPTSTCMQFGKDAIPGGPTAYNDSIRNFEWNTLKNFYLSYKNILRVNRDDATALNSCEALNDCIGVDFFNPHASGMFNNSFPDYAYNDINQPCSHYLKNYYRDKVQRFPDPEDNAVSGMSANEVAYQQYLITGQCPKALAVQTLLSALATKDTLVADTIPLLDFPEYAAYYIQINDADPDAPITDYDYDYTGTVSVTGDTLSFYTTDTAGSLVACVNYLIRSATSSTDWNDIAFFTGMNVTSFSSPRSYFTIYAAIPTPDSLQPYRFDTLTGNACGNILNCNFQKECGANVFALDLQDLMTALAAEGDLNGSEVDLQDSTYLPFSTNIIRARLGSPSDELDWTWDISTHSWLIDDSTDNTRRLRMYIRELDPPTFNLNNLDSITGFFGVVSTYEHYFTIYAHYGVAGDTLQIDAGMLLEDDPDTTGVGMGSCGLPDPALCQETGHLVLDDLQTLLSSVLLSDPDTVNLYDNPYFTPLLQSFLGDTTQTAIGIYTSDTMVIVGLDTLHRDSLLFELTGCYLDIWHQDSLDPLLEFSDLFSIGSMITTGDPDEEGYFHEFYIPVVYHVGGAGYYDTLYGETCWPLKNCTPCVDNSYDSLIMRSQSFIWSEYIAVDSSTLTLSYADSITLANGEGYIDNSPALYVEYKNAIDSLNTANGWGVSDSLYVTALNYIQYKKGGYNYTHKYYLPFIQRYIHEIDAHEWLVDPSRFVIGNGALTNVKVQYRRYRAAQIQYNARAVAQNIATLPVKPAYDFKRDKRSEDIHLYIAYLDSLPDQYNDPADSIDIFYLNYYGHTMSYADSCDTLYQLYLDAYDAFELYQDTNNTCYNYELIAPLYSQTDFEDNNLCCSDTGMTVFNNYIDVLEDTLQCPGPLPYLSSCDSIIGDDTTCLVLYYDYLDQLTAYNASQWADSMNVYLDTNLYPTYEMFLKTGRCECANDYIAYLDPYIATPVDTSLSDPVSIDMHCTLDLSTKSYCSDSYYIYIDTVTAFNAWALTDPTWDTISTILGSTQFTAAKYCYCVEGYVAYLNAIMEGVVPYSTENEQKLNITVHCGSLAPECIPEAPITGTYVSPILTAYNNPCVEYLQNTALMNARNAYDNYVDSLTAAIRSQYIEHCLSAVENFTATYIDKEYHFTLYYYDQAGNLIKTVPPEGVQLLNITAPDDDTAVLVNNDRTYGTKTIFTSHRMETRYEYNSLNQLVKQSMPDHDKMTIWETALPNGLDSRFKGTEVTFTDASNGYMSGFITVNGIERGMLYRTSDGGTTWKKVDYTAATNIKKIFWVNDTLAYGVGTDGVALKTVDGGSSWDVLNDYETANGLEHYYDLYFNGVNTGIFVGDAGSIMRTTDGGATFTSISYAGKTSSDSIVSVEGVGATVRMMVVKNNLSGFRPYGQIYTSSNTGSSWLTYNIREIDYQDIQYVDGDRMIASGDNGHFSERTDLSGSFFWYHKPTNTSNDIKQIYFINENEGISLQDSATGYGQIYKTSDAGYNWELLSGPGKYYRYIYGYKSGTVNKVLAVGHNGLVSKVLLQSGYPFGMIDMDKPTASYNLKACWAVESSDGKTWMVVATDHNDGHVWITKNGSGANQTWAKEDSLAGGISHIMMRQFISGSDTTLSGTVIKASTLKPWGIFYNASAVLSIASLTGTGGTSNFIDQVHDISNSRNYFLDQVNRRIYYSDISGASIPASIIITTGVSPATGNQAIDYGQNDTIYFAQTAGNIGYGVINNGTSPPTISWTNEVTSLSKPLPIRDVEYNTYRTAWYACGDGGAVYRDTTSNFRRNLTNIHENLNAMKFYDYYTAYVVGDNGKVYQMTIDDINNDSFTELYSPTTENLTDIAISGDTVYITGENGVLLYSPDITSVNLVQLNVNFAGNLNGVAFRPGSTLAYVAGDNSRMFIASSSTVIPQKNIYLPRARSVDFYDKEHGYMVADNFNLRYTDDAGQSWQTILPSSALTSLPVMFKVRATGENAAMAVGSNRTLYDITDLSAVLNLRSDFGISVGDHLYDAWQHDTLSFVVKANLTHGYLYRKIGSGSWSLLATFTNKPVRYLHGFTNGNMLLAGYNGKILYYNYTTATSTDWTAPTGLTTNLWYDIFAHDDLNMYVVGENGAVLRSKDFSLDASGYHVFGSWERMQTDDSLQTQTDSTGMAITSIAFPERYSGVMTGSYSTTPLGYHRRIHDESQLYSTYFWYDKLGRIVLSQNTKQFNKTPKAYSYTIYDQLGRVVEAGEKRDFSGSGSSSSSADGSISMIFGDTIATHYNPNVINDDSLMAWINNTAGIRTEVTHSWYDVADANIGTALPGYLSQANLRKRIAHVTYEDTLDNDTTTYDYATHYSYDIHGNVKTLLQDNQKLLSVDSSLISQRFKRMDYSYDLISGNVHKVSYQKDSADAWHHRYEYDADNRITDVYTSSAINELASVGLDEAMADALWDHDAKYFYYAHGPLARMETGDLQVQGTDFAYTLQGWIKGVNSTTLDTLRDIGKDGWRDSSNLNMNFPKDVYSYSLNYFEGDYSPIDNSITGTTHFLANLRDATNKKSDILQNRHDLYNGNIGAMATTITNPTTREVLPLGNAYKYDQLNRLIEARSFDNIDIANNRWDSSGVAYDNMYFNKFSYDANGNILSQWRFDEASTAIDSLFYQYAKDADGNRVQNRLYHVNDSISNTRFSDDIDDMGTFDDTLSQINSNNNYSYTAIGELEKDTQEEILAIVWRVDSKVKEVYRTNGSSKKNLKFDYDPMGNRIAKHIFSSDSIWEKSTYYARDAQGNVMSVYEHTLEDTLVNYDLTEQHIYGSSRLGMRTDTLEMVAATVDTAYYERILGKKQYEFSNHLGNVLTVISDKKLPLDWDSNDTVDSYHSEILMATDYSSFGVSLEGRDFADSTYRYGFNGMEKDDEVKGSGNSYDFDFRMYDPRIGRFISVDPIAANFAFNSPYAFAENKVIQYIEIEGLEIKIDDPNFDQKFAKAVKIKQDNYKKQIVDLKWKLVAIHFKLTLLKAKAEAARVEYNVPRAVMPILKMDLFSTVVSAVGDLGDIMSGELDLTKTDVDAYIKKVSPLVSTYTALAGEMAEIENEIAILEEKIVHAASEVAIIVPDWDGGSGAGTGGSDWTFDWGNTNPTVNDDKSSGGDGGGSTPSNNKKTKDPNVDIDTIKNPYDSSGNSDIITKTVFKDTTIDGKKATVKRTTVTKVKTGEEVRTKTEIK